MSRGFLTFSTRDIAAHRKVASWDEHASAVITGLHVEPSREAAFDASFKAAQFGGIGFIEAISTPTRVVHTQRGGHGPEPYYLVHIQHRGTCVNRQASSEVLLQPGDFVLCDDTLPCELLLGGENEMLVLRIPQQQLRRRMPTPELYVNRHMRGDRGSSLLASSFVNLFWRQCQQDVAPAMADRLADSVCDLLTAAFLESGGTAADGSTVQTMWKLRIRRHIDANLGNPHLTPTLIAEHFRVSTRYLHKLYANEEEAISRYVLRRRLECCHRALTDIDQATKTVSTVAFEWGFNNTTHFARVFRERYGQTPSELRRQRRDQRACTAPA